MANKDQLNVIPRGQRSSQQATPVSTAANELLSPEPQRPKSLVLENLPGLVGSLVTSPATSNSPSSRDSQKRPLLIPDLEEIRLSPLISKKGYLNVLGKFRIFLIMEFSFYFLQITKQRCGKSVGSWFEDPMSFYLETKEIIVKGV